MLNRITQATSKDSLPFKSTKSTQNSDNQHGLPSNNIRILLDVASETLTGITSYLDPPSLLSLGTVNGHLHEHVNNDNTWHRAFVCQFLGIGPESNVHDNTKSLMLRRSEISWKGELIVRYSLRRRWERSRNPTITHIPVHTSISSMHLMPGHSLLTSSIEYGIISRSFPLTGKILPGFLDAFGTRVGMGIGNPNAEFTPNVAICVISSNGGTTRVLWGFRNGEVAVLTAPKTMDIGRRTSTEFVRCEVDDEHEGGVLDGLWADKSGTVAITAGADGRIKVWNAQSVQCVWTSENEPENLAPDACVKVAVAFLQGSVIGALRSGELVLWTGFDFKTLDVTSTSSFRQVRIPCPIYTLHGNDDSTQNINHEIASLYLDPYASCPTILVNYQNDSYLYRICITQDDNIEVAAFGDVQFGPISVLTPFFSTNSSFVLTGDYIGCVSVYDWHASAPSTTTISNAIQPVKKFEAHEDGAGVTALAWNGVTLITGSARGMTHVWDGLTFEHLRSFVSPVPQRGRDAHGDRREREGVSQIIVGPEKELLLVTVGDRVLAWKAGPVPVGKNGPGGVRGKHTHGNKVNKRTKDRHSAAKYLQELEMRETISESRTLLELQSKNIRRANGREREQLATLESLGLDEAEAVEYVLMLSRDEALQNSGGHCTTNAETYQSRGIEEGIFEGDFDDIPSTHRSTIVEPLGMASSSTSSFSFSSHSRVCTPQTNGQPVPRTRRSNSNQKIQVSPPYKPETWEAGLDTGKPSSTVTPPSDKSHFPPISASTSPSPRLVAMKDRCDGSESPTRRQARNSFSGSPRSIKSVASSSAWKMPLVKSAGGSPGSMSSRPGQGSPRAMRSSPSSSLSHADMDDDLRLAIKLSLAEARSREHYL